MFDSICKFLAETFSTDFTTWLLGELVELTELSPSELSLEPIRVDALILRQSEQVVLHIEFHNLTASAAILAGLVLETEVMRALATEGHYAGVRYLSGDWLCRAY